MVHVNFVVVLIAAVVQWILGALWYGLLFKKSWRSLTGLAEGEKPKGAAFGMIISFIASLLVSYILALVVRSKCIHPRRKARRYLLVRLCRPGALRAAHLGTPARQSLRHQCGLLAVGHGPCGRHSGCV